MTKMPLEINTFTTGIMIRKSMTKMPLEIYHFLSTEMLSTHEYTECFRVIFLFACKNKIKVIRNIYMYLRFL